MCCSSAPFASYPVSDPTRSLSGKPLCVGGFGRFPGGVGMEEKEEFAKTAREWEGKQNAIWTYGSRLDDGRVEAAAVW